MSTTDISDEALERRLRALAVDAENTDGWEAGAPDILEAAERIKGYAHMAADKRRLTREIAAMIDGPDAAKQPALCDVAAMVRDLVEARRAEPADQINATRVAEAIENEGGNWLSCTGCHELNEGRPTGRYSPALKCHLGGGCTECGGIGAIWDTTDYAEMGDWLARQAATDAAPSDDLREVEAMLNAGQGDDDGSQILPDFDPDMSVAAKVEACLHLLEQRRDVIAGTTNLLNAVQAVIDGAERPGSRRVLGNGVEDDQWEDYQEVPQKALDALSAALSGPAQEGGGS